MPGRVPRGDLRSGSAWERLSNREAVGSPTTAEAPPSPQTPTVVEPSWSASALSRGKLALSLCHTLAQSPRGSSQPFGSVQRQKRICQLSRARELGSEDVLLGSRAIRVIDGQAWRAELSQMIQDLFRGRPPESVRFGGFVLEIHVVIRRHQIGRNPFVQSVV